jgi:hypothetical protein
MREYNDVVLAKNVNISCGHTFLQNTFLYYALLQMKEKKVACGSYGREVHEGFGGET